MLFCICRITRTTACRPRLSPPSRSPWIARTYQTLSRSCPTTFGATGSSTCPESTGRTMLLCLLGFCTGTILVKHSEDGRRGHKSWPLIAGYDIDTSCADIHKVGVLACAHRSQTRRRGRARVAQHRNTDTGCCASRMALIDVQWQV